MEKIVIELEAKTGKAVKDVEKLNKSVTETTKTAKKTGKGLSGAFKGLSGAITGAIPMLGKLKTALISTGVGALVVVFGSLVALFKSVLSFKGRALSTEICPYIPGSLYCTQDILLCYS